MRTAALFCVLATAAAWKMPPQAALLEKGRRPQCILDKSTFVRQPTLPNSSKWGGSQRQPTELELKSKDYLAEPYLHTIYFINLDRSADRQEHMLKQLNRTAPGTHCERFAAKTRADAKLMNKELYTTNQKKEFPGSGTAATYLSHWHMLEKIAKHNDSRAVFIVLEDDAVLTDYWSEEVMCQIQQLPADWDLYKFGYWPLEGARWAYDHSCSGNIRQARYNEYTCNQRSFALEWMGNLGYAVRPQGAAKAIEHLSQVPVMDVDGAMMPGCCISNSSKVPQNVYVSRYSLIKHGKFNSVRLMDKRAYAESGGDVWSTKEADPSLFSSDTDRETSYQARVRLSEGFKQGTQPHLVEYHDEDQDNAADQEMEMDMDKVQALALGV